MLNCYVGHSTNYDYQDKLYAPILALQGSQEDIRFYLPHEHNDTPSLSLPVIQKSDVFLAEISYASTGLGMELGWAYLNKKPIVAIHHTEAAYSPSIKLITNAIHQYDSPQALTNLLHQVISQLINEG